jgi:Coenzyme PQQ synthesis protein D (PqqD)
MGLKKSGKRTARVSGERRARAWQHVDLQTWIRQNMANEEWGPGAAKDTPSPPLEERRPGALPRARQDGVLTTELDDEVVVYDVREHRAHCLNPAAAAVWRHLDGRTSMSEMVAHLRKELDPAAGEDTAWLALTELDKASLLETPLDPPASGDLSRRSALQGIGVVAAATVLLPVISSIVAPPAHAQVSGVECSPPDTCETFTCETGCACVPTTEGTNLCIVPICVQPCTTTADCPPGTVCFTLGCCAEGGNFCVPIASPGMNCEEGAVGRAVNRRWN